MCMRIPSFSWVNVVKNAWFAPAKRPRCYPVRVLGFDQPDFQGFTSQSSRIFASRSTGGCFFQLECWGFTRRSAGVLPDGVLGFYQPEYWGFTRRSAGVLPAGVLRFFTSQSAGILPAGVLGFLPAGVLRFFTSWSAGVLPAGVLRFLTARVLEFYQPEC